MYCLLRTHAREWESGRAEKQSARAGPTARRTGCRCATRAAQATPYILRPCTRRSTRPSRVAGAHRRPWQVAKRIPRSGLIGAVRASGLRRAQYIGPWPGWLVVRALRRMRMTWQGNRLAIRTRSSCDLAARVRAKVGRLRLRALTAMQQWPQRLQILVRLLSRTDLASEQGREPSRLLGQRPRRLELPRADRGGKDWLPGDPPV